MANEQVRAPHHMSDTACEPFFSCYVHSGQKEKVSVKALMGRKIGMTQILEEDGTARAITLVQAGPCVVTQLKSDETDGYNAVQIGFETHKRPAKQQQGHAQKAKIETTPRVFQEIRGIAYDQETITPGTTLDVSLFAPGDEVDITGTSKGKGFAGTIKRHNFMRSRKTHGGNGYVRRPGSIGSMYPQKVFKGKRMAGRMGHDQVTEHDHRVVLVDTENNLLGISGAIPGPKKGLVLIRESK
jgi:large subunit ribosomal protein L3